VDKLNKTHPKPQFPHKCVNAGCGMRQDSSTANFPLRMTKWRNPPHPSTVVATFP